MKFEEVIELIRRPEYEAYYPGRTEYPGFEKLIIYGHNMADIFDDLLTAGGGIPPNQKDYIIEGKKRSLKYFIDKRKPDGNRYVPLDRDKEGKVLEWGAFNWDDPRLQSDVEKRLARQYISHINEYITVRQLKHYFKNRETIYISDNMDLDKVAGVDIALGDTEIDKIIYFHITRNTYITKKMLHNKEQRYAKFGRDFSKNHINLLYDTGVNTNNTHLVNGIPVFTSQYLESKTREGFNATNTDTFSCFKDSYIQKLMDFLDTTPEEISLWI